MKNKTKVFMFIKLLSYFVSFILVTSFLVGDMTFAWFTNRYESPYYPSIEGADFTLDVNFTGQGSVINMSEGLPVNDNTGINYDGYELSVENIGNVNIMTNLKTEIYPNESPYSTNPELILFRAGEIKYALLLKDYQMIDQDTQTVISTTPDPTRWQPTMNCHIDSEATDYECRVGAMDENIYEFLILPGEKYEFELKYWVASGVRDLQNKMFYGRIVVETAQEGTVIVSTTESNPPTLVQGMIPVIWDDTLSGWEVIGDWDNGWYNYSDQDVLDNNSNVVAEARQWANVVTVKQADIGNYLLCQAVGGCTILPDALGTIVPEEEISSHFVWIPRFRYAVRSNIANGAESLVDAVWEYGNEDRFEASGIYSGATPTNFYTSSAFLDGDRQMEGFWISKFQLGTGPISLVSKPDQIVDESFSDDQWQGIINTEYQQQGMSFFGLNYQNYDRAQQVKGSQWDAIAFLSQSRYGKFGYDNQTVLPNNNFSQVVENESEINYNYIRQGSNNQDGTVHTITQTSTITSMQTQVKTGYSCAGTTLSTCLTYDHDYTQNSVYQPTTRSETGQGQGVTIESSANSNHYTTETLSTDSVLYSDSIWGGNSSTTGNIYGVYDMAMAREEITSTIYTQTGLNHTTVTGLETLKTFPILDTTFNTLYVAEDGTVYDNLGNVIYTEFLDQVGFGIYEYIIDNTNSFDFTLYNYFTNYYHNYTVGGDDLYVMKGSTSYMFDSSLSGYSLFGARVEHGGSNLAYVSRGGALSGIGEISFKITNIGLDDFVPTYSVVFERDSSLAPQLTQSGIFAQYSQRVDDFNFDALSDGSVFDGLGDPAPGAGNVYYDYTGTNDSSINTIYTSSRVTIVV